MSDIAILAIVLIIFFVGLGLAIERLIDAVAELIVDKIKEKQDD